MKKYVIFILFICLICCTGCYRRENGLKKEKIKEIKIGVTIYNQEDVFIIDILHQLEKLVAKEEKERKKGGTFNKVTLYVMDAKGIQTGQNDQVDRFIAQNCDVLCVNLVDRTAAATIIDKGKAAGVPIVFFNREPVQADMQKWSQIFYVGSNAEEAGRMQGEIIRDVYLKNPNSVDRNQDGKIQYVMLEGEQNHQDTSVRSEYCLKPIQEQGIELEKLASATANWQMGQAEEKMTLWLKEYEERIEVVFSNNDEMALGAMNAIKKADIGRHIQIVGVDGIASALEAVENGDLTGTVLNDAKKQAESIFRIAMAIGTGEEIPKEIKFTEARCVRIPHKIIRKEIK